MSADSSEPTPSEKETAKSNKRTLPKWLSIAIKIMLGVFALVAVLIIWGLSPALRACFGPLLYMTSPCRLYVMQASLYTRSDEPMQIALSGNGSSQYSIKLYKNDGSFLPDISAKSDPAHVLPWPNIGLEDIRNGKLSNQSPIWQQSKGLRFTDLSSFYEKVTFPANLAKGDYFFVVEVNGALPNSTDSLAGGCFRVSDLSFIVKGSPNKTLLRVFNAKTMAPVEGAEVQLCSHQTEPISLVGASARTANDGTAILQNLPSQSAEVPAPSVFVKLGDDKASLTPEYQSHDLHWQLLNRSPSYGRSLESDKVDIITDKPIYRLGQTVQLEGFYRRIRNEGGYDPATPGEDINVEIRDPQGNVVKQVNAKTGEFGEFFATFPIPEDGKTGIYNISTQFGYNNSSIEVMQYRKPEYEVTISPEKPYVIAGNVAKAKLSAKYFFGGPVAHAQVKYAVTRAVSYGVKDRLFSTSQTNRFFGISSASRYQRFNPPNLVTSESDQAISGLAETNDKGELEISFDTHKLSQKAPYDEGNQAQDFTITATVTDLSRKSADTTGSALVTPGDFALSLETTSWFTRPGDTILAKIRARDYNNSSPVPNKNVKLSLEEWAYVPDEKGQNKYQRKAVISELTTKTKETGDTVAEIKVPSDLKQSNLLLCARSQDEAGDEILDYVSVWVANQQYVANDFKIELDKLAYEPGETVKAMLTIPESLRKRKFLGLASLDGTSIIDYKAINANNANMIEFKLTDNAAPSAWLAVTFVDEELGQYTQQVAVQVYPRKSLLDVTLKASKEKMEPGQEAEFLISAKDFAGKAAANVPITLSLVDESIYAIKEETSNVVDFFQKQRPLYVNTFVSTTQKQELPDQPVEWIINPFSSARYAINTMCCDAIAPQSLAGSSMPQARMAKEESFSANRLDAKVAPMPSAAPVPAQNAASGPKVVIRSDFRDTAFFSGKLITDSKGEARIKTKLPDNLTTWRATSSLVSKATAVAFSKSKLVASKAMIARLALPRFFTQDDEGVVTAIVHNFTDKTQKVELELNLPAQITTKDALKQSLQVASRGAARITWPVQIVGEGKSKITLVAKGSGVNDALVQDLNILPHSFPAFAYKNGIIRKDNEKIEIPLKQFKDARKGTGSFMLKMAPSAIGPVLGNFDKLINYPYGCTEQTMSRVMPSVVATLLHKDLQLPISDDTQQTITRVYHKSLAKLAEHHNADGGWGWWQGDQSNVYLTAYVLEGLHWLKRAGFTVDQYMLDSGNQWLEQKLNAVSLIPGAQDQLTDLCYGFYALSLEGKKADLFARLKAPISRASSGPEALAYLTLAYENLGMTEEAKKSYSALKELANNSWDYVNWEHTPELLKRMGYQFAYDYSYRFTPTETTALAFRAVLKMEPNNDKLTSSIRNWILMQHDENGWTNTKTTAQVFLALLSDELKMGGKRPCNFDVKADISGKTLAAYLFNQSNRYETEKIINLQLQGDETSIVINKNGQGNLHYSSTLEYQRRIEKGEKVIPRSSPPDLTVERTFYRLERYKIAKSDLWGTRAIQIGEESIKTGDTILMKVKIHTPFAAPYIKVEAPLPSGAEVISDQTSIETYDQNNEGEHEQDASSFNYWWTHQDILDDRIVFFVTDMQAGNSEFQSLLRMEMPGKLNANPVSFEGMYTKSLRGYSAADTVRVLETKSAAE